MVVSEYHLGCIIGEAAFDDFARIDAGFIDGAKE
jgi:hypothetical protein